VTINQRTTDAFVSVYRICLKLSVGTVLTSRQIRWSPNFSCTIDSDAIGKWGGEGGKGLVLPHFIKIWGASALPVP